MHLSKDQGGTGITHRGVVYAWENDGDVTEVPHELGVDLVALGGYRVVPPPDPEDAGGEHDSDGDPDAGDGSPDDSEPGKAARKPRGKSAAET